MRWNRSGLLFAGAALALVVLVVVMRTRPDPTVDAVRDFMDRHGIRGAVVAFGPPGEHPRVEGLGLPADALFAIASLSKPMVAAEVLRLDRAGALSLDDRLAQHFPEVGDAADPRYADITVRQLLGHTAGWDRNASFEPIVEFELAERELGVREPEDCRPIALALLDRPLDRDPGTHYAYSNVGYCWLEQLVALRGPMEPVPGIRPGWDPSVNASLTPMWVDGEPRTWTTRELRVLGAAGGWTSTATDYFAFASRAVDPRTYERMPGAQAGKHYYGLGWRVWPNGVLSHYGAMPGTFSVVVRSDEFVAVALFDGRPEDDWSAFLELKQALITPRGTGRRGRASRR